MTLADIRGWVSDRLQDTSFEDSIIDSSANWMVSELVNNTRLRFMEENDTLFASAGDTTVDFPDDMQTFIKEGLYLISPQVWDLAPYFMEYGDFMKRFPGFATYTATSLYQWTDFANAMRFAAPLNADIEINIDYIRRQTLMVNPTDVCDIPDAYQEIMAIGTLARCMDVNEDYGEAQSERNKIAPNITAFIRNESRGNIKTGGTRMRSNRHRRGSSNDGSGGFNATMI